MRASQRILAQEQHHHQPDDADERGEKKELADRRSEALAHGVHELHEQPIAVLAEACERIVQLRRRFC